MKKRIFKIDTDTVELIEEVRRYLFSIGIRTSRERAWDIFKSVFQIPFNMLIEKNPKLEYSRRPARNSSQVLSVRDLGRFVLKANVSGSVGAKFHPSTKLTKRLNAEVEVIGVGKEEE